MKTAISLPDDLFERVATWAAALGVGRSGFFAHAAERYLAELEAGSLTRQVDDALDLIGDDDSWRDVTAHGRAVLARDAEDW